MKCTRMLLFLCAAALLAETSAQAQGQHHGAHPPMPGQQFYLQSRLENGQEPQTTETAVNLPSVAAAADLDQTVQLPAPLAPLRLKRYLPQAILEQNVVPCQEADARRAIQISITGPKQSYQRWLVAGDQVRNRLTSFIGTWRYMAVEDQAQRDELFRQFENEFTRAPKLLITNRAGGRPHELPVKAGAARELDDLKCRVRVERFYPDFAFDQESGKPINQSDELLNPAVLVEIEHAGQKHEQWVFAKFPDFQAAQTEALPCNLRLDCPIASKRTVPDFAVVTVGADQHEAWTRQADTCTSVPLALQEPVKVGGSQYTFSITRYVPTGQLVETYHAPAGGRGGVPALQLETTDASGAHVEVWLPLGKQRAVPVANGTLVLSFGPRQPSLPPLHGQEP